MVFHTKLYQNPVTLDRSSFIGPVINGQNNNPIPTIPRVILKDIKNLMVDCADILKRTNLLKPENIVDIIDKKYPEMWNIYKTKEIYK